MSWARAAGSLEFTVRPAAASRSKLTEAGVADAEYPLWYGSFVPARTPHHAGTLAAAEKGAGIISMSAFGGIPDMHCRLALMACAAIDPKRT
jgi:hypothetical protein